MEAWKALAQKALKGAPLESLGFTTADGAVLDPLHGPAAPILAGRSQPGPWQAFARVDADDHASDQALDDLSNGAVGLTLVFAGAPSAHGRGLTAADLPALRTALSGILIGHAPLRIEGGAFTRQAAALVFALCDETAATPPSLRLGYDPLGSLLASGHAGEGGDVFGAELCIAMQERGYTGTALRADGRMVAEAGGTPGQELGFALAVFAHHLRTLDQAGIAMDRAFAQIEIALSASQDQFATMAKMRAARRLHRLMAEECGVDLPAALHADTLHRMLSFTDPTTNLLRNTVAAFAAGVGGADTLTVLPHTAEADPFSRRIARNIQNLLIEEAHTGHMIDPGAGAGAVEAATDAIAQAAWARFQSLEAEGVHKAIANGTFSAAVRAEAVREAEALESGESVRIGVNRFPPPEAAGVLSQQLPQMPAGAARDLPFHALLAAAAAGESLAPDIGQKVCEGLAPRRVAEPFERHESPNMARSPNAR